jgi:hypothetical protein
MTILNNGKRLSDPLHRVHRKLQIVVKPVKRSSLRIILIFFIRISVTLI